MFMLSWPTFAVYCLILRLDSAKTIPYLWPKWQKSAKIDTLFMTNTAEKPYPLGPHIYSRYKGVPPPPLRGLHSFDGSNCGSDLFTQFINVERHARFSSIYIPSDFTEETCSIGTLSMKSSSVSDRVINLSDLYLEPINIDSVFYL